MACVEESRRVQAAGLLEHGLIGAQGLGQPAEDRLPDGEVRRGDIESSLHGDGIERGFAANAAARRSVEMALEPVEVDADAGSELDADDVDQAIRRRRPARPRECDVRRMPDDAFGEQKSDGELLVVARGAHRDRDTALDAPAALAVQLQADFQRLLGRDHIIRGLKLPVEAIDLDAFEARATGEVGEPGHQPPTRLSICSSMSLSLAAPIRAMSRSSSVRRILSALVAPASPPAPRPYR